MDGSFQPLFSINPQKAKPSIAKIWCNGFVNGTAMWKKSFIDDKTAKELIFPVIFHAKPESVSKIFKEHKDTKYTDEDIKKF